MFPLAAVKPPLPRPQLTSHLHQQYHTFTPDSHFIFTSSSFLVLCLLQQQPFGLLQIVKTCLAHKLEF